MPDAVDASVLLPLQFVENDGTGRSKPLTEMLHLVPGDANRTLCDAEFYSTPGFTLGTAVPVDQFVPCPDCVSAARARYPNVPVKGTRLVAPLMAETLGVQAIVL